MLMIRNALLEQATVFSSYKQVGPQSRETE